MSNDQVYFTGGNIPSEIGCIQAYGVSDPDTDCCTSFEEMNAFLDCIALVWWAEGMDAPTSEPWFDCWQELDTGSDPLIAFSIDPLDANDNTSVVATVDAFGNVDIIEKQGNPVSGLYNISLYTLSGRIIPTVYEHRIKSSKDKDKVKLDLTPNPIVNNELKFKVSSELLKSAQLEVKTLNGTILHSEAVVLSEEFDLYRTIPIDANAPYNQLRVTLTFNDGSFIQETALN